MKRSAGFYFALFAVVIMGVYLWLSSALYQRGLDYHREQYNELQSLQVQLSASGLARHITRMKSDLDLLATLFTVEDGALRPGSVEPLLNAMAFDGSTSSRLVLAAGLFAPTEAPELFFSAGDPVPAAMLSQFESWAAEYGPTARQRDDFVVSTFAASPDAQYYALFYPLAAGSERVVGLLVDFHPLLERFVIPVHLGENGAAWLQTASGLVIYDHETEIIGSNTADLHQGLPDAARFDARVAVELSGIDEYSFTMARGGPITAKLVAWQTVTFGDDRLVVALSTPSFEIDNMMLPYRIQTWLVGTLLGLAMLGLGGVFYLLRRRAVDRLLETRVAELAQAEQRYHSLFENIPDAVLVHDDQERLLDVNNAACRLLGYDRAALLAMHLSDFEVRPTPDEKGDPGIETTQWRKMARIYRSADGRRVPVHVRNTVIRYAGQAALLTLAHDISDLQRTAHVQAMLLRIARAASETSALHALLEIVHRELSTVIDATNFYVALYDSASELYHFPYWVDTQQSEGYETRRLAGGLTDRVRRQARPMIMTPETAPGLRGGGVQKLGVPAQCWLGAPLRTPDGVIGVVALQSYDNPQAYGMEDLNLLSLVAENIAWGIERRRAEDRLLELNSQLGTSNRALHALYEIGLDFNRRLELPILTHRIIEQTVQLLDADAGSIYLYEAERGRLVLQDAVGSAVPYIGLALPPGEGAAGQAFSRAETVLVNNYWSWSGASDYFADASLRAALAAPMHWQDTVIGVLTVVLDSDRRAFGDTDRQLAEMLASQAVTAIVNARLFEAERRQRDAADMLRGIGLILTSVLEVDDIVNYLVESAQVMFPRAEIIMVHLFDEQDSSLSTIGTTAGVDLPRFTTPLDTPRSPIAHAIRERGLLYLPDLAAETRFEPLPGLADLLPQGGAMIVAPLVAGGKVWGALRLAAPNPYSLKETDASLAELLARQAATAIENARLYASERRQREIAHTLYYVGLALTSALERSEILSYLVQATQTLFPQALGVTVQLLDGEQGTMETAAASAGMAQVSTAMRFSSGVGIAGHALAQRRVINVPDVLADPRYIAGGGDPPIYRAMLVAPLLSGERAWGTLSLTAEKVGTFSQDDEPLAELLARQAAVAIENAYLYQAERKQHQFADTLRDIGLELTRSLSLQGVLSNILQQVERVLPVAAAVVWLQDEQGGFTSAIDRGYDRFGIDDITPFKTIVEQSGPFDLIHQTRDVLIIPDTQQHKGWDNENITAFRWVRSWVGAPLHANGELLGFLALDHDQPNVYGPQHRSLLQALANHIAAAIRNARLYEDVRRQRQEADTLREISLELTRELQEQDLLARILEQVKRLLAYDGATIWLRRSDGLYHNVIGVGYWDNADHATALLKPFKTADLPDLHTIEQTQHARVVSDTAADTSWLRLPGREWIASWASAPILSRGKVVGFFALEHSQPGFYRPGQEQLLEALATQVSIAIENARLYEKARTDAEYFEDEFHNRTAALHQEKQRIETILRNIGDAVLITNLRGVVIYANAALERFLGLESEAILGQPAGNFLHETQARDTMRRFVWLRRKKIPWRGTLFLRRSDGLPLEVEATSVPYTEEGDQIIGFIVTMRPIGSERSLERMKSQFMELIRDQFRTPVQNLKLQIHLLRRRGEDAVQRAEYLDVVDSQTERINDLIRKIENATRLADAAAERSYAPLSYGTLLDNVRVHFGSLAEENEVALHFEPPPSDLPVVLGDEPLLTGACYELVENALQYTPPGGKVLLRFSHEPYRGRGWVVLRIQDTGQGIAATDLASLDDSFTRVGEQRAGTSAGMGIGLYIARTIVGQHGGRLTVTSTLGEGSCFAIWLPAAEHLSP